MPPLRTFISGLVLVALAQACASAETLETTAASTTTAITVDADKTTVFGQPLQFLLMVRNNAPKDSSSVTPTNIQVVPIGQLASAYDVLEFTEGLVSLAPGQSLQLRGELKFKTDQEWQRYFHTTQAYELMVDATWSDNSKSGIRQPVSMLSSPLAVVTGGILGALLLTLFTHLSPLLRTQPENTGKTAGALLWSMLVSSLMGAILAMMIIAITRATASATLPVAIKVDDFVGGLMVGMLSHVLIPWLAEKLKAPVTKESGQAQAPDRKTEPTH